MANTLTMSAILCLFANSWAAIWVLLEMNTLSFCSFFFIKFSNETKKNKEMTMKYLIIQSIASALLVMTSLFLKVNKKIMILMAMLAILSLMLKTASAPTHQWFINMSKKTTWKTNSILFTWQKFAPVFLIIYQMKLLMFPFLVLSSILGAISMMNKLALKEILAFSSIFNLSWMFLAITISTKVFVIFSTIYWVSLLFVMYLFNKNNTMTMQEIAEANKNKVMTILMFMSLAGLPPLMGFAAKWFTFSSAVKTNVKPLVTVLLVLSAVNLFVYLRAVNPTTMKNSANTQKLSTTSQTLLSATFFYLNTILLAGILI